MIIHISGSSGSGKTSLLNLLKLEFPNKLILVETDHLLDETSLFRLRNTKDVTEAKILWKSLVQDSVKKIIEQKRCKPIIFSGLLRQSLPSGAPTFFEIKEVQHKFFLNPPIQTLLKRYYTRLSEYIDLTRHTSSSEYWDNLGRKDQYIMGSLDIIKEHDQNLSHAKENGYHLTSETEDLIRWFEKIFR